MKKTLITLLLVALVASTCTGSTCPGTGQCSGGSCSGTGQCSGGSCNTCGCSSDPSFPVNQEVCISTPGYISPPSCVIPTLECPTTCPPPVTPPHICVPVVDIPEVCPPPVVAPPTVTPPSVCIPTVEPCVIVAPAPPQLPGLGCGPIVIPGMPSIPKPSGPQFCDNKLTSKFQLTFSYACRKNRDFSSCSGNIVWNDVILHSIVPTDYAVHIHTITVYVKAGENKLQFEGTGFDNSFGLTIDNVKLIRDGTVTNIVVNGGFEQPDVGHSWGIHNNIPGWTGVGIEVGWGKIYNNGWNSQVVELDGNHNYQITQKWSFDSNYKLTAQLACETNSFVGQTLLFKLEFDFAARKTGCSSSVVTSQGSVIWNNIVVVTLAPTDFAIKHAVYYVELKAGDNSLQFDGASSSDSFGLTIDNVRLTSPYCPYNLINNGEFENPSLGGGYNFYNGGIPYWKALKAEVGDCHSIYNPNWPANTGQCIELDTDKNTRYTQTIHISQFKFNKLLINKSTSQGSQAVINHVQQAEAQGQSRIGCAVAQIQHNIYCEV